MEMQVENRVLDSLMDNIEKELKLRDFLNSSHFKRGMSKLGLYEVYHKIYNDIKYNSRIIVVGRDAYYRTKAFKVLLDQIYSNNSDDFFVILAAIFRIYESWDNSKIYMKEILLDLELLPNFIQNLNVFDNIGTDVITDNTSIEDPHIESSIDKVKSLEAKYIELRSKNKDNKNSKETIECYHKWYNLAITLFSRYFDNNNLDYQKFKSVDNSGNGYILSNNFNSIQGAYSILCDRVKQGNDNKHIMMDNSKIFIVHGHDNEMKSEVNSFLLQLGFEPIILNDRANNGNTVIEKLEVNSNVGFAIILLSPCDEGRKKGVDQLNDRARQNVILELGYFIGRLGRNKICTLKKSNVEEPSDFTGIVYTDFDIAGAWKIQLCRELKGAGYHVDINKML